MIVAVSTNKKKIDLVVSPLNDTGLDLVMHVLV